MESSMPDYEEIRMERTMQIFQINTSRYRSVWPVETLIDIREPDGSRAKLVVEVTIVDDQRIKGYLPSRCWFDGNDDLRMTFYATPSLPSAARPFGDGPLYVFCHELKDGQVVEYDIDTTVFIEHMANPLFWDYDDDRATGVRYVFVCGPKGVSTLFPQESIDRLVKPSPVTELPVDPFI